MSKYNEYKSLKQNWLRSIPLEWELVPTKYIFSTIGSGTTPKSNNADYYSGSFPWIQSGDLHGRFLRDTKKHISQIAISDSPALKIYRAPFISIAMYGASIGNLSISNIDACTNQACCNLSSCRGNLDYFYYAFSAAQNYVISLSAGGTQPNIKQEIVKNVLLPVPPRSEQDQIVRYLDWQVSKINRLISAKKREIERIGELKKTIVNEAVTHGLHPDVPMKFSGVDWLGDIPARWTTLKLRQILHPVSEKNHPELPLLSVVREQGVIVRNVEDKETNHNFIPDDLSGYKMVKKGQFAMNKMKAWQGSYGISEYTGIVSPAYFIFDVNFENLRYFHYAIRSKVYVNFFAQASDGIRVGQWDLDIDKMKEIPFIVPPADEQKAIVDYIPIAFAKYDEALVKLTEEVDILHELRTRLISDVVTGQIDVRGIEIPDFEYVEVIEDALDGDDESDDMSDGEEAVE